MAPGLDRQGLACMHVPPEIHCAQDYERLAARSLPGPIHAYIAGGSGRDLSVAANLAAFGDWSIYPRLLRDLTAGHTRTTIGSELWPHPIALAPVAYQGLAHPHAERETARAAQATDTCLIASTLSSLTLQLCAYQCL